MGEKERGGMPIYSIRTKITAMALFVIMLAMVISTAFGVVAIRDTGKQNADQMLLLLAETGQKNLNHYFESVERAVEAVASYVQADLNRHEERDLTAHLEDVRAVFQKFAYRTYGVLTYYYRIDPLVSKTAKGFWYTNLDGEEFREHEVTDISLYDVNDTSKLVWFTVPRASGKPIWLSPYVTDNLDVRVISYNIPIYQHGIFIGVIGIEIDYSRMAREIDNITLFENGYAFLNDAKGKLIYHPRMDVTALEKTVPVPEGVLSTNRHVRYTFEGAEKQGAWVPLRNGTRIVVTVPVEEINAVWHKWIYKIIVIFSLLLVASFILIMTFVGRLTRPLRDLTKAAEEVGEGNYDVSLSYEGRDEVGKLTRTFKKVSAKLKAQIDSLNDLAYADALTSLHNKGAFDQLVRDIQEKLGASGGTLEFAICIFDCNHLKEINDCYGHDKGDIYLKDSSSVICLVFDHSPVFRIGGDEFAAVLLNQDFKNREALLRQFDERCLEIRQSLNEPWRQIEVARGMAVYDPSEDASVNDVVRRADRLMYENKWSSKQKQTEAVG